MSGVRVSSPDFCLVKASRILLPLVCLGMAAKVAWAGSGGLRYSPNLALPSSYRFQEYQYPETDDAKACTGTPNSSAALGRITFAQTHVMEPGWTFFFLIANRPALIQVAVTGSGASPDVRVEAFIKGVSMGSLCLGGPAILPASIAPEPRFTDRFSATLPAKWLQPGLSVEVKAGSAVRKFTETDLRVGPSPEMNLVMLPFDVLDFNKGKPDVPVPPTFLADFAGAIPASVVRLGHIPGRMSLPRMAVSSNTDLVPVVLETSADRKGVPDGNINAAVLRFVDAYMQATGDHAYSFYYGNTENFFPGGWGGGKAFVGADFKGVFLHEMGHALSLPHWGEGPYADQNPDEWDYRYPYGGTSNNGGGRGETWNFYQNIREFVSPICGLAGNKELGKERSDAMQRTHHCEEQRSTGRGPWDGFGDFSAIAMYRNMVGAEKADTGTVAYKGGRSPYHLSRQVGFPTLKLDAGGKRILERSYQPMQQQDWERHDFLVPQEWDVPVYTVYGTFHPQYAAVNFLYDPMAYVGNLPKVLDPTDTATFNRLASGGRGPYGGYFYWAKDLTFKFIYTDGSVLHAIYPYDGVGRDWKPEASPWRRDILYFTLNIPARKKLARIELYKRPFLVRGTSSIDEGNIANTRLGITAGNFLEGATLVLGKNVNVEPPGPVFPTLTARSIGGAVRLRAGAGMGFSRRPGKVSQEIFNALGASILFP